MIEFTFSSSGSETGPVWGSALLAPLAPDALTPFSGSLLTEIAARAWYLYYDRLGFDPSPRSRIVRLHAGHPFVNLTLSATLDAEHAGVTPPLLRLDGVLRPLIAWEKPGFWAGMKLARGARKIEEVLHSLQQELPEITARTAAWQSRVAGLRWSQAEVLQIMEEIERVGATALLPYFAARHNLEWAYRRLLTLLAPRPEAEAAALLVQALGGAAPTVELEMAQHVLRLGQNAAAQPVVRAWLKAGAFETWQTSLPSGAFAEELQAFMARYGQRGLHEGEIAAPRWSEAPDTLFAAIRACAEGAPAANEAQPADPQPLLAAVDGKVRKEVQQLVAQMQTLLTMQSQALHAVAYLLAGTRQWALAAAREALTDHRITSLDAIFFYEVEEVKEMMTGEWNVSDRHTIHATAEERQQWVAAWRRTSPPALIWGEREATLPTAGLPAAAGRAEGCAVLAAKTRDWPADAILITQQPESAAAILLPAARAFVTAQGSPLDSLCACARSLGRPGVVAAGAAMKTIAPTAHVAVDGALGKVTIL